MSYKVDFILPYGDDWATAYAAEHNGDRLISVEVEAVPREDEIVDFTVEGMDEGPGYIVNRVGHIITPATRTVLDDDHLIVVTLR